MDLENISKTLKIDREETNNIHLNTNKIIYSDVVASNNDTILTIIEDNSSTTT